MEIEFQNTKADYVSYNKAHFITQLKKRIARLIIASLLIAFLIGGQPFKMPTFLIVFFITFAVLFLILYIPYLIDVKKFNKLISKNNGYLEKTKLTTTETGIILQSIRKTTELNWQSINSVSSSEKYIQIELADKKMFLVPKHFFASENEVVNFLGIVQTEIIKTRGILNKISPAIAKRNKPPYLLGLLCLIPLVGAFVGLGLLLYGLLKYKDKWLSIIGAAGIVWTIVVYSSLCIPPANHNPNNSK